jgi:hypothetical protein
LRSSHGDQRHDPTVRDWCRHRRPKDKRMTDGLIIGLFPSSGIALDAYHRLRTEGVPASRLAHRVLKEVGPVPTSVQAELEALQVDPLVFGDARNTFAHLIHNGETAVIVQVTDDQEAEFATDILKLYTPLAIETVPGEAQSTPQV